MLPITYSPRALRMHPAPGQCRSGARRRGQALLLAVVVLVFAALLGTTFVAVVAINIGQTSRSEERNKAKAAAQAGLDFINQQLTYSTTAINWQPNDMTGPPEEGDPSYDFYWTPFDRAQGWDLAGYVKFPDPRSPNQNLSTPNYMAKVEKILPTDADNADGSKTGARRISIIGFSPDDPNSYYKLTAYKAGPAQMPLTGAMRSVTNWDFSNGVVPSGRVVSYTSGTPATLVVDNVTGQFPAAPFYITVGGYNYVSNTATTIRSQAVSAVSGPGGGQYTLTLSTSLQPTAGTVSVGDRVDVAAAIGAPLAIDYNNDGTADPSTEKVDFDVSTVTSGAPGSTWVNGSLIFSGNTFLPNLRAPQLSATQAPGQVKASGLIQVLDPGNTKIAGTYSDGNSSSQQSLLDSSSGSFPYSHTSTDTRPFDIVSDGAHRIANVPDATRQVTPFTPPDITDGSDGFARYRELTKYSTSTDPANPQGAAYGYGEGIYLNNYQDRERKRTGSAGVYSEMTQQDLLDLWFRSDADAGNRALRLSVPYSKTSTTASLEEMHFRGWVSPNEFVPRGAQIELDPANVDGPKVHITLENRNDGQAVVNTNGDKAYEGPVPSQGWHSPGGTLLGDAANGGVYYKTLDWPQNGVIFAEGNVRVRGGAFNSSGDADTSVDPQRSLTIVSMGNIYIEGSINAGARKVLLLAKKNVVVNPGAVISPPDAKTWLSNDSDSGSQYIQVHDAGAFHAGEFITVGAGNLRRQILSVDETNGLIQLDSPPTVRPAGDPVRLVDDPLRNDTYAYYQYAVRLARFNDALQRRVYLPYSPAEMRLAFRHSAERRDALKIGTEQALTDPSDPPQLTAATLVNKLAANGTDRETTIIQPTDISGTAAPGDKALHVDYTDTATSGTDDFPQSAPPSESDALDYRLGEATDSDTTSESDDLEEDLNSRRKAPQWKYSATVQNNYNANNGTLSIPPSYFLAAVGNRPDVDPATAPGAYPMRKNIFVGNDYTIPMATSVILMLNGSQQTLRSDRYSAALGGFEAVNQFGFNFTLGAGVARALNNWEDVLTVDQSFYRNGSGTDSDASYDDTYYTLDSRTLTSGFSSGWNSLALELNPEVKNYFDATTPPDPLPSIPYYRLARLKIENAGQLNSQNEFENLSPGYKLDIRAYVYAQEGSWLIIPGDYFDGNIRTDASGAYQDLNGNGSRTSDPGETADLNGDGRISRSEQVAAYRFLRYNYQINFTGAIMERHTALVSDPDGTGTLTGQVADWVDKWATVNISSADFSGATQTDAFVPGNMSTDNGNFSTINYSFDPDAARGQIDGAPIELDIGWHPPISPELMYQSG